MSRATSLFVVLLVLWLLLSGKYHLEHDVDRYLTGCGVLSCLLVVRLAKRHGMLDQEGHPVHLLRGAVTYFPWIFWQIVLANLDVMKRVWNPRRWPISPAFVWVPYSQKTDLGTVIYANSITLTPGTVTTIIDTENRRMLIHCITEGAGQDLLGGGMDREVCKMEGSAR